MHLAWFGFAIMALTTLAKPLPDPDAAGTIEKREQCGSNHGAGNCCAVNAQCNGPEDCCSGQCGCNNAFGSCSPVVSSAP